MPSALLANDEQIIFPLPSVLPFSSRCLTDCLHPTSVIQRDDVGETAAGCYAPPAALGLKSECQYRLLGNEA